MTSSIDDYLKSMPYPYMLILKISNHPIRSV